MFEEGQSGPPGVAPSSSSDLRDGAWRDHRGPCGDEQVGVCFKAVSNCPVDGWVADGRVNQARRLPEGSGSDPAPLDSRVTPG